MTEFSENRYIFPKSIMTIMVIFIVFVRLPELLLEPRFWAEEGTSYFSHAYNHNWLINLFTPQFGYNTLYNSIATSLAASVPLEYAPSVTTYLAFFVQVTVSAAVIWWDIPLLDSLSKKFALALFIQILAYPRIWVTTIGVQYWLCILSFLILLYNHQASNRKVLVLQNCLLALNGLTGILSCVLIPVFALKSVKTKSMRVMTHTAILIVCLLVQVAVFSYAFMTKNSGLKIRFDDCSLLYMLSKLIKFQITAPFFGLHFFTAPSFRFLEDAFVNLLSTIVGPSINSPKYNFFMLEMFSGLMIISYLVVLSYRKFKQLDTQLIVISILLVTAVSTYFSVNSSSGPRYAFAPSIMIMTLIVGAANDKTIPKTLNYLASFLVVMALVVSFIHYRVNMMGVAYDPSWPKWQEELSVWKADHDYPIRIWPPPWKMTLSGK